jgi:hypothetical protein
MKRNTMDSVWTRRSPFHRPLPCQVETCATYNALSLLSSQNQTKAVREVTYKLDKLHKA